MTKSALYNVAGLFEKDDILFPIVKESKVVKSVYGCPPVDWNGGDHQSVKEEGYSYFNKVKEYNDIGIGCYLTFTNPYPDLNDTESFKILEALDNNPINGVVIVNYELLSLVKKHFPNLKTKSSLTILEYDINKRMQQYLEFAEKFDDVIIYPDDNRLFVNGKTFGLNPENIEILVNDGCAANCIYRKQHYSLVPGRITKEKREKLNRYAEIFCPARKEPMSLRLNLDEIEQLKKNNIKKFKLQGRGVDNDISPDLHYYLK